jgi:hypothetical protein
VAVYAVGDGGATGARLGSGSLVDPRMVLVNPPLAGRLAALAPDVPALRVGIAAPDGTVEVIDSRGVQVSAGSGGTPLVGLELSGRSGAPTADLGVSGDDRPGVHEQLVTAVSALLAEDPEPIPIPTDPSPPIPPFPPPPSPPPGGSAPMRPFACRIWPSAFFC